MGTQVSSHFFVNWAKGRLDEMDAILTSLENNIAGVQDEAGDKTSKVLAGLRKKRDEFREAISTQSHANEAAWISARTKLESEWSVFEGEVKNYIERFSRKIEQQQATFKLQSAAQLKAWREAADRLGSFAKEFAAERRGEIDAVVKRMNTEAAAAEEQLQKLNQAGGQSWSALMTALTETRAAFDRANQAAKDAFEKAT